MQILGKNQIKVYIVYTDESFTLELCQVISGNRMEENAYQIIILLWAVHTLF